MLSKRVRVFFLVAWTVEKIGFNSIYGPLGWYMATVLIGLAIHGFIVLPLVLYLFSRKNPFTFMWQMKRALMTAVGTDSSSATLPVTIDAAEGEGGCSKRAANFVLPLGRRQDGVSDDNIFLIESEDSADDAILGFTLEMDDYGPTLVWD